MFNKIFSTLILSFTFWSFVYCQTGSITGKVVDANGQPVVNASVSLGRSGAVTDSAGLFKFQAIAVGKYNLKISLVGHIDFLHQFVVKEKYSIVVPVTLIAEASNLVEVVVTGVSRVTLARENPVAISVISSKAIDKANEPNIIDALVKNVPGLNAVKTGPNISKPFIRGLGYNRVLTLYDGIRQEGQQWGDEHGIEVDGYNIDKAEVIKGPASLMFGSDALAGVVSMFPFLPKEKDGKLHGRILSEYQSNNGLIGNGARLSYNNGHWLWVLRGSYRMAKNYSNKIDGRVYNSGFKEANIAATIGHISANGYSNLNATLYDNLQGIPDGSRDSLSRKFTKQIYEGVADDITNRPIVSDAELNSYQLSPLHQHIQHYRVYSNNHYQLGDAAIDASIGFQQNSRREYSHPTAAKQASLFVRLNTINYDIKYIAPSFCNIELTIGANGMYQNNKSKAATDFPIPDYNLLDIGGYIYGKWKQNKLTISGGFRYDSRQLKGNDLYVGTDATTGFGKQVFLPDTTGAMLQFAAFNKTFSGISLSVGATYQLTTALSLKANVARGYRAPNITEFAANGLDPGAHIIYLGNRNFVPEFSFQQDIGISGNFKDITASISVFNNNIQNYIYLTQLVDGQGNAVVDAQGNKTFSYQQAAAQLYGTEVSVDLHPQQWKGFSFSNNFSVIYGFNKKAGYKNAKTNGEYLLLIPPAKWLSSISQEFVSKSKIFSSFNVKAELEYSAAQNRFLHLFNTETATPSYALVNLSAGTFIKYSKKNQLQLQVQVNNLFDVAYQSNLSRLKYFEYYNQSSSGKLGIYNMGRNVCVKLIAGF